MGRGPTDEAVVIVKPGAGDPVVTQVRVKHRVSAREAEVKGGTRKRNWKLITDCGPEISPQGSLGMAETYASAESPGRRSPKGPCKDEGEKSGRDLLTDEYLAGAQGGDPQTRWEVSGYALREEPCTDPYARFCGQTGGRWPSL
jgi:hypothetical protein